MDASVYNVLKSHAHSKALLKVGESYGFFIGKSSAQNQEGHSVINLGSIPFEDLVSARSDVPLGYEEDGEEQRNCVSESITLNFVSSVKQFAHGAIARLAALEVFPRNNPTGPVLSFLTADDELLDRLELRMGESVSFDLQFTMPKGFCGHLKRLVLLTFEVTETVELLVSKTTTLKMGFVVLGSVLPRGVDRSLQSEGQQDQNSADVKAEANRKLSVEAKVFSPISAITHFDTPVSYMLLWCAPSNILFGYSP